VDLVTAVRHVAAGLRYLSPPLSEEAIAAYASEASASARHRIEALTDREREVLDLLAKGLTSGEIGRQLVISRRTAEAHRARVMHKLGLQSQSDLVRFVIRYKIVPLD
jgi:DNA-binding NarL/FixJ family response regulator